MKTLEERAQNAWATYEYREGCLYSTTFEDGYVQGANEQKAIDDKDCESLVGLAVKEARQVFIDKACEWLDINITCMQDDTRVFFIERFRKAMTETINPLFEKCLAKVNPEIRDEVRRNMEDLL